MAQARLEAAGQLKAELARSSEEADSLRGQLAAASRALWTGQSPPSGSSLAVSAGPAGSPSATPHKAAQTGRIGSRKRPLR